MKFIGPPSSGSVNCETYSRNRFGQYVRNRSIPVQPRTPAQVAVRGYLTEATKRWAELTDTQRDAWNEWAQNHKKTDQLGQSYVMTGHQAFVGASVTAQIAGLAPVAEPPEFWAPPVGLITKITLALSITYNPPGEGDFIFIYSSGLVKPSVNFVGTLPFMCKIASTDTPPLNFKPIWEAKYGTYTGGYKIVIRACYVKQGVDHGPYEEHVVSTD
jgi:hypothetical protein